MTPETFVQRCSQLYAEHPGTTRGWQSEFARRLNVNDRTVRRWVSGDTPIPLWVHRVLDILERNPSEIDIYYGEETAQ